MKPNISEFSYGYALTEELIRSMPQQLSAAPTFPSLIEEDRPGGGYDVKLQYPFMPIFLQFKLSDHVKRRIARKFKLGLYILSKMAQEYLLANVSFRFSKTDFRPCLRRQTETTRIGFRHHITVISGECVGRETAMAQARNTILPSSLSSRSQSPNTRLSSMSERKQQWAIPNIK